MTRRSTFSLAAIVLLIGGLVLPAPFNALTALRRSVRPASTAPAKSNAPTVAALARQPIHFEPSADQTQARFVARGRGYSLKLAPTEATVSLRNEQGRADVTMHLLNANLDPQMTALDPQQSVSNYLIGNDPSKWRTAVPNFGKVKYEAVYPGIDLVYYGNQRQLEYDFLVAPGVDPAQIKLAFTGAKNLKLADNGDLMIATASGELRQHRPVVYQELNGERQPVAGDFVLADHNRVHFALGEYDHTRTLVIDPTISYSTYLGSTGEDKGHAIAIDSSGNVFTTGETDASGFPAPSGYDTSFNGTMDVFVTKVNTSGTGLSFSTFLGGSGTDIGRGVAVDSSGNVFVAGETDSNSTSPNTPFPVSSTGGSSYAGFQLTNAGGVDAFVTKLDSSGATLLYSTYLGGSSTDRANGVALDSSGNIYAIGETGSTAATFPETSGAYQTTRAAGTDAFVGKINPNVSSNSLSYLTYFGGNGSDRGFAIAVDSGLAHITGQTGSSDFPEVSAQDGDLNGPSDAFVAKLNSSGTGVTYSTYLGGGGREAGYGIAIYEGEAHVTGEESSTIATSGSSTSSDFIVTNNTVQSSNQGGFDIFVIRYDSGGTREYANIYGGSGNDSGLAVALDSGKFVVTGETASSGLQFGSPTQGTFQGGIDAFVLKIDPGQTGSNVRTFFTYHAGTSTDSGRGIAVSGTTAYITGYTDSLGDEDQFYGTFPVTTGVYQGGNQGGYDAFAAKLTSLP